MAGYYNTFMSNNAVEAYSEGEKPWSKWTKHDIIMKLKSVNNQLNFSMLKKMNVERLRDLCLVRTSWHHTGAKYERTEFFMVNEQFETMNNEQLEAIIQNNVEDEIEEVWICSYLVKGQGRAKPTREEAKGFVKGEWFVLADGTKRKVTDKGFRFIKMM